MAEETEPRPVVLVVDDDRALADMYAEYLGEEYEVRTAYDGEAALEAFDERVDVVLLDRRMPGFSGDEVLEALRERNPGCGVVMLTAVNPDFDVIDMAFDEYLVKPVTLPELEETVSRIVALVSGEAGPKQYFALVSKKYALELRKGPSELRGNDAYLELLEEISALRDDLGADIATRIEAEASAAVFSARDGRSTEGVDLSDILEVAEATSQEEDQKRSSESAGADQSLVSGHGGDLFDTLFNHLRDPIFVVDQERTIVDCNDAFTERFGYERSAVRGEPSSLLYEGPANSNTADDDRSRDDGSAGLEAVEYRTNDGEVFPAETAIVELYDGPDELVGRAALVLEIGDPGSTPSRPAGEAPDVPVAVDLLLHELNNELSIIAGRLGQLEAAVPTGQQEPLDQAQAAISRLGESLQDVGEVLRAVDAVEEESATGIAIVPVVEQVVDRLRRTAGGATIELGSLEPATVRATDLLDVVVRNLVDNAIQHNDSGSPTVEVDVATTAEAVRLRVADNGPGIPPAVREAMLEAEQKGRDSDGMGLGLYLVNQLVSAFGGSIEFEDNDPSGTAVVVEFERLD